MAEGAQAAADAIAAGQVKPAAAAAADAMANITQEELDDLIGNLEACQRLMREQESQIKALSAEDTKAELHKALKRAMMAERTADESMDRAAKFDRELRERHKAMMKIGKLFGVEDWRKLYPAVAKFHREHAK